MDNKKIRKPNSIKKQKKKRKPVCAYVQCMLNKAEKNHVEVLA